MDMYARLAIGADGNIADQRSHLDLLIHGDRPVGLRLPIEERELSAAQGADGRNLGSAKPLAGGKLLEAAHGLVPST